MNMVDLPSMRSETSSDESMPMDSVGLKTASDSDDFGSENQKLACCGSDLAARRLRSSRAASLLDDQLEDDEGDEPDLEVTDDDDATSNSTMADDYCEPQIVMMDRRPTTPPRTSSWQEPRTMTPDIKHSAHDADGAQSLVLSPVDEKGVDKLVCLTDGMITNYFCPTTVESIDADAMRVQVQTNNTMRDARNRSESDLETDTRASSEGAMWSTTALSPSRDNQDCYSSVLSHTNNHDQSASQTSDATPRQRNSMCSDPLFSLSEMRQLVAADVAALLGTSRGAWLIALRDWLLQPSCTKQYYTSTSSATSSKSRRRVVRNRISVRDTQTRRMQQLWLEWHAQSLDNMEDPATCNKNTSPRAAVYGAPRMWSLGMTRSLDDSYLNTRTKRNILVPNEQTVSETFYDSDPESFRRSRVLKSRTHHSTKSPDDESSSFQVPSPINTTASFASPSDVPTTPRNSRKQQLAAGVPRPAPSFGLSSSSTCSDSGGLGYSSFDTSNFDLRNDTMVEEFLKEVTFRKISLVLHPDATESIEDNDEKDCDVHHSNSTSHKSPISVQCWFEMGSRLENRVVQPKFMWRKTYQPNLSTHRKLICHQPDSIELLSMVRILKPSQLNRKHFPFAKVDHSFSILANNKDLYLFEAQSRQERDWIVHGLKLVVARLASMIIVGDEQMFVEFFSPWAHSPLLDDDAFLLASNGSKTEEDEEKEEAEVTTVSHEESSRSGGGGGGAGGVGVAARLVPNSRTEKNRASLWGATAATTTRCGSGKGDWI